MNEFTTLKHVNAHLDALMRNDVQAITDDFAPDLRPHVPGIIASLSLPLAAAEQASAEIHDDVSIVHNRITGADGTVLVLRSEWREVDGRPRIVAGAPVTE
jgi:hypothetical protein